MIRVSSALAILLLCFSINLNAQNERDTTLEFYLNMTLEEILSTKVTIATKSEQKLSEAPAIVTVITAEEIKNKGARTITDVLQFVPGFEFSRVRTGFLVVGVRGVKDPLTNSRFLILKDGAPYNGIMYGSGFGLTQLFDINTIERIEVIRGPGSALYGRNAFTGVINIITKPGKEKNKVEGHVSAGNFNTYNFGASFGTKKKDFNTYFAFEKSYSDITNSKFDNGMDGESIWTIGVDNLFINTKIGFKDFELTAMYSDIANGASVGPFITNSDKSVQIGVYSLSYKKQLNSKTGLQAKIYGRNEFQVQHLEIFKPNLTAEAAPGVPFSMVFPNGAYATPQFNTYNYGADINLNLNVLKNHLLLGLETGFYGLTNVDLKSSYDTYTGAPLTYEQNGETLFRGKENQIKEERGWIEGNGHDYTNFAFYLQDIFSLTKNMSFTLGGRYDIDSEFGGAFNPRLAMVWDTQRHFIFKLLYGQAYRAPNSQEQYRKTGFTVGNKDLKPETIKTTELSINYVISKNINTKLTGFYNTLNNMIYAQGFTSGSPGSPYSNIGENTSIGLEYEYSMLVNEKFYLFFNYSYTVSENKVTGDTVETFAHRDIAPHKLNAGINYQFLEYFNFNTSLLYRSERKKYFAINKSTADYILDNNGNKTVVSQDKIGDYFLLNAKLRVFDFLKGMEVSAEVYNLLNTKYYDQDTEYAHQPTREGRHFIFSLSYNF